MQVIVLGKQNLIPTNEKYNCKNQGNLQLIKIAE
jgi:hypothetical protein